LLLRILREVRSGQDPPGVYFDPQADMTPLVGTVDTTIPAGALWKDFLPRNPGKGGMSVN
jgi:hypothetical protein